MIKISLFALVLMTSLKLSAQRNYLVQYRTHIQQEIELPDTSAAKLFGMQPRIEIEANFYVLANSDSGKIFFKNPESTNSRNGFNTIANTPDTLFYRDKVWTKLKDGTTTTIETKPYSFAQTNETKDLLGYKCIKFISTNPDFDITLWACKDLPNTLIPISNMKEFEYGILEVQNKTLNSHSIATQIRLTD